MFDPNWENARFIEHYWKVKLYNQGLQSRYTTEHTSSHGKQITMMSHCLRLDSDEELKEMLVEMSRVKIRKDRMRPKLVIVDASMPILDLSGLGSQTEVEMSKYMEDCLLVTQTVNASHVILALQSLLHSLTDNRQEVMYISTLVLRCISPLFWIRIRQPELEAINRLVAVFNAQLAVRVFILHLGDYSLRRWSFWLK